MNASRVLASVMVVSRGLYFFRMCERVPLSRLSLISSHAALVVVGSARESNEESTAFASRWSVRKEMILRKL